MSDGVLQDHKAEDDEGGDDADVRDEAATSVIDAPRPSSAQEQPKPSEQCHDSRSRVASPFVVGQWIDALDTVEQWLEATVLELSSDSTQVLVHYNGWPSRWDEWIDVRSPRLSPFRTKTLHSTCCRLGYPRNSNSCTVHCAFQMMLTTVAYRHRCYLSAFAHGFASPTPHALTGPTLQPSTTSTHAVLREVCLSRRVPSTAVTPAITSVV